MSCKEKLVKRDEIYNGKIIKVYNDVVSFEGIDKTAYREVVSHNGGVCAVVRTKDNKIKFVRQFRYPFLDELIELPAGKIDEGETADDAIYREIVEEVGVKSKNIQKIGVMYPSPGYCNEIIHLYYVDEYELSETNFDEFEFLDIEEYSYFEALEMIEKGIIVDAKTICLLLRVREKFMK